MSISIDSPPVNPDTEVVVRLPLRDWAIVAAHLQGGVYREVAHIIAAIWVQGEPQWKAAETAEAAERASRAANPPTESAPPAGPVLN